MNVMNLFMAIYHEHKDRTHHDIYSAGRFSTLTHKCDVCLYLDSLKREYEEEERKYHESGGKP